MTGNAAIFFYGLTGLELDVGQTVGPLRSLRPLVQLQSELVSVLSQREEVAAILTLVNMNMKRCLWLV